MMRRPPRSTLSYSSAASDVYKRQVLDEINFMSTEAARNWCEKATGDYKYKSENFAKLVKKYLDKKESNHHIVFLIDEIGQYIGDDSKLMLNLQTATEDLGTCLLYTSPSPRDGLLSRMPSSA